MRRSSLLTGIGVFVFCAQAEAAFLGLSSGLYDVTLTGSVGLCSSSPCTGQLSIPVGDATTANFDWTFTIGSDAFNWGSNVNVDYSPNQLNSVAIESLATPPTASCTIDDASLGPSCLYAEPALLLYYTTNADPQDPDNFPAGGYWAFDTDAAGYGPFPFTATRVPEPATLALFGLGLAGIPFVRRRRTPA